MLYAHVPTPWDPNEPPKSQIVGGEAGKHRYQGEARPKSFFRLEDRKPDIEFINDTQLATVARKPILWRVFGEVKGPKKVLIPFEDRAFAGARSSPRQLAGELDREDFKRVKTPPKKTFFFFEHRPLDFGQALLDSQDVIGIWPDEPWKLLKRGKQRIFFKFEDRRWNIAFLRQTQIGKWDIKPNTWYAISDEDYFPPSLRRWLRGRCFMMVRLRSGAGLGTPANGYITEDGQLFYCAEDGTTFYVQET